MGNNIAKHISNLAFGQKQHVTLMVAFRYLHSKAPLLSGKRMVSLLLVFLLSLLDYFTQKGRSRCTRWEPSVSTVETGRFHAGNRSFPWWEQTRNYVLENLTRGLSPCELTRLVVSLLLLLVVGVNNAWGQATDYSGIYYIASDGTAAQVDRVNNNLVDESYSYNPSTQESNYYLVPASNPAQPNANDAYYDGTTGQMPFLTTFKIGQESNPNWGEAVWVVRQVTDGNGTFYYIMHAETGKYVIYKPFFTGGNSRRKCMHLEKRSTLNDSCKFVIEEHEPGVYDIVPKSMRNNATTTHKFWNIADRNRNSRHGLDGSNYYGGLVGLFSYHTTNKDLDYNSRWKFEKVIPRISSTSDDKVELTFPVTTTTTKIHYTSDGSNPTGSSTQYTTTISLPSEGNMVIKAIAVVSDGATPTPNTVSSEVAILLYKPDIALKEGENFVDEETYTYDGSAKKPTVNEVSITKGENIVIAPTTAYSVTDESYSNNTNAGDSAIVTLTDADASDTWYIWNASKAFTINPKALTVTADAKTKEYGDPDPVLTYTVTGLLEGDELTSPLSRDEGEATGTYNIILASSLGNTNYTVGTFTGATFTITPKSLGSGSTPAPNITCDVTETGGTHSIVVKQCGNNLILDTDYTKEGENDGAKYYQVTVKGKGNYKDGFSVKLAKIQLSKLSGSSAPGGAALFVSDSGDGDFVVPDNMTAYIVTGVSGNTLVTEQLDNIPTQVPVLLVSTIDANGFLVQTKDSPTAPSGTNLLEVKANDWENIPAATIYLLYNGEFVLNAAGTLPAGKIYLPRTSGAPSRLFINWDEVTGIEDDSPSIMDHSPFNEVWYTLDGRRLNGQPKKKGLYLNNGKKVVIR